MSGYKPVLGITMGADARAGTQAPEVQGHLGTTAPRSGATDRPLILVVDDDPLNRTVMSAMLQKLGYRFHLATNGREAVDAIGRDQYAAVLMDCLMPLMDGYEATATIRRIEREGRGPSGRRHVPIIAVTAVAIKGARERCIAAGMDDYLSKPVMIQSVASLLDRWTASTDAAAWSPPDEPAPEEPEEAAIDRAALESLRAFDAERGDTLVSQMIADFGTEIGPRLPTLKAAAAEGDVPTVLRELHFIAGCASIVGATRVERLARSLEADGAVEALGGSDGTAALATRLEEEVRRAQVALAAIAGAPR